MKKIIKLNSTNIWFLISSIWVFIIMILIFLIIGFSINSTKIYKVSGSGEYISFKNGLVLLSNKTNIINISDFGDNNYNEIVKKLKIDLYIGGNKIYSIEKENENGFKIKDILEKEKIYIEKNNIKTNIETNSYIKLSMTSIDNKKLKENVMFDIYKY